MCCVTHTRNSCLIYVLIDHIPYKIQTHHYTMDYICMSRVRFGSSQGNRPGRAAVWTELRTLMHSRSHASLSSLYLSLYCAPSLSPSLSPVRARFLPPFDLPLFHSLYSSLYVLIFPTQPSSLSPSSLPHCFLLVLFFFSSVHSFPRCSLPFSLSCSIDTWGSEGNCEP